MKSIEENLTGKVVIITGASSEIGRSLARKFLEFGCRLMITDQNETEMKKLRKEFAEIYGSEVHSLIVDVRDESKVASIIEECIGKFGKIDILINNAGYFHTDGDTVDDILANFDEIFAVNVRCLLQLCMLARPHLKLTKGSIINFASATNLDPITINFQISKKCVEFLTEYLAAIFGTEGIRVNCIKPGAVQSKMFWGKGYNEERLRYYESNAKQFILAEKYCDPDELAQLVIHVASNEHLFGSILLADGGYQLKMASKF